LVSTVGHCTDTTAPFENLGIMPWGAKARAIASGAIAAAAEARVDPADLTNAAINALIRERCELPMLSTLRELAATAHRVVNTAQWEQVHERLNEAVRQELDALLTISLNWIADLFPENGKSYVGDGCADRPRMFNRRHLEVVAILELAEAIKAGAVNVTGSLSYEDFWAQLPIEGGGPERIAAYAAERGWSAGAVQFTAHLRDNLEKEACQLDTDVGLRRTVQLDKNRRPIVPRIVAGELPVSVAQAVRQVLEEMPERSVLEALANTAQWANWPRHCGLPSRFGSGIQNVRDRYVITTFAYGSGLGPAQAARHFGGAGTAEDLSFVDRRHVDIADLRAGSADLQNLYSQFDLPKLGVLT